MDAPMTVAAAAATVTAGMGLMLCMSCSSLSSAVEERVVKERVGDASA